MKSMVMTLILMLVPVLGFAQIPEPPEELSKFTPLLGNWKGSGTARETPEGAVTDWTAVLTVKKILDGHAIQEDVKVDLGPEAPAPLLYRTLYWWDTATKHIRYFSLSNFGFGGHGTIYETADGKLIGSTTRMLMEVPTTEQVVTDVTEDGVLKLTMRRSVAGAEFFTGVEGTYKRGGKGFPDSDNTGGLALLPPPDEMAEVQKDAGAWSMKGRVSPVPGAPMMQISGRYELQPILGGHAALGTYEGAPVPGAPKAFQGVSYLAWDPHSASLMSLDLDNFGVQTISHGYRSEDGRYVYLSLGRAYGVPQVNRTLVEPDEGNDSQKIKSHRLAGGEDPDLAFEALLERVQEAEEAKAE